MRLDNLEELRVLEAVIDAGSIVAAADQLGLSARTVGRRLSALEERLGTTLVSRTTRTLGPTEAARAFSVRCTAAMRELTRAEEVLIAEQAQVQGTVRLGVPSLLVREMLSDAARLAALHPHLELDLTVTDQPIGSLRAAKLDLAVTSHRPAHGADRMTRLLTARSVMAAAPSYLARTPAPRRPTDLSSHQCLRFRGQQTWTLIRGPRTAVVPVHGTVVSGDSRLLREALLDGMGIGPVSPTLVSAANLVPVLPGWRWPAFELWMIAEPSTRQSARVQVVSEAARAAAERYFLGPS